MSNSAVYAGTVNRCFGGAHHDCIYALKFDKMVDS